MSKIVKVIGREIIDSRGNPTVEAEVHGRWFRRYGSCSVRCFLLVPAKRWNCAMATNPVSRVKA